MNPYYGVDFVGFFLLFLKRLPAWACGSLASDELQLFTLICVSTACALVGSFLVLRRMAMLANSLSHTILLGIVIAYFILLPFSHGQGGALSLPILLIASLLTALLTAACTTFVSRTLKLQEDASIGLVFTTLFALGVVAISLLTRNAHIGVEAIMGNVDALHLDDLKQAVWVCGADLLLIVLFFKQYKATSFDPLFAKTIGISIVSFHLLLMLQTAATSISAFRAVGVLLVLAFLVGPPLTARLLTNQLGKMLLYSSLIGSGCSFIGVALSRHLLSAYQIGLSTGALVVALIGIAFLAALFLRAHQHRISVKHER